MSVYFFFRRTIRWRKLEKPPFSAAHLEWIQTPSRQITELEPLLGKKPLDPDPYEIAFESESHYHKNIGKELIDSLFYFRFALRFPDITITYKGSLIYVFFLFRYAQRNINRRLYFTFMCMITALSIGLFKKSKSLYLCYSFVKYWFFKFLFLSKNDIWLSFYAFEMIRYLSIDISIDKQRFSSDYFHNISLDPKLLWDFNNFYLRVDLISFNLLWKSLEGIRIRFYNAYMKHHYYINNHNWYIRWGLRRGHTYNVIKNVILLAFLKFFEALASLKFRIYKLEFKRRLNFLPKSLKSLKFNWRIFSKFGSIINILKFSTYISSLYVFYFAHLAERWIIAFFMHAVATHSHLFPLYNRSDYEHIEEYWEIYSESFFNWSKIIMLWMVKREKDFFKKYFLFSTPTMLYYLFFDLMNIKKTLKSIYPFLLGDVYYGDIFAYNPLKVRIHDGFRMDAMPLYHCLYSVKNRYIRRNWDSGLWKTFNFYWQFFKVCDIFGNFYEVNLRWFRFIVGTEFNYWRVFHNGVMYKFLDGRLPLRLLYSKLEIDYILYYRYQLIWKSFRKHLRNGVNDISSNASGAYLFYDLPFYQRSYRNDDLFNWYFTIKEDSPDRGEDYAPMYQLINDINSGKRKSKLGYKLTFFIFYVILKGFLRTIIVYSKFMCYQLFFVLWKNNKNNYYKLWSYEQGKIIHNFFCNYKAYRKTFWIYLNWFPHYRRWIGKNKKGIHSKDPSYRAECWRFFHKMRRTGFIKSDLIYYCYEDDKDLIKDLADILRKVKHHVPVSFIKD